MRNLREGGREGKLIFIVTTERETRDGGRGKVNLNEWVQIKWVRESGKFGIFSLLAHLPKEKWESFGGKDEIFPFR